MGRQTYVVDVCFTWVCVRQMYRVLPKTEVVYAIRTFGNGEE